MGSRNDQTTVYWIGSNIQIVCGCFRGGIQSFEEAVNKKYGDLQPGHEYFKLIKTIKLLTEEV